MTKTVNSNYGSVASPGNTFNNRISADSDTFARNDIDALGNALDLHTHASGLGLPVNTIPSGGLTVTAGGLQVVAGNVGIGISPVASEGLNISASTTTSVTQYGAVITPTASSAATSEITGVYSLPASAAAAFTCTTVTGFHALNPTKGAGSTITSAYGLLVDAITSGNTNNYGINVGTPSGGSGENYAIKSPHIVLVAAEPTTVTSQIGLGNQTFSPGGGATATLGTIGGSGPGTAAQLTWWRLNIAGSARFIPVWQ